MKFIIATFVTALSAYAICLVAPWWCIAISSFVVAYFIHQKSFLAFLSAAIGVGGLWGMLAAVKNMQNNGILSTKVAGLLGAPNATVLIVITIVIGALVAGFAALTASFARPKTA